MKRRLFNRRGLLASLISTLVLASLAISLPSFAESNRVSSLIGEVFSTGAEPEKPSNPSGAENTSASGNSKTVAVAPLPSFPSAAQSCSVMDDFNRADNFNLGVNWTLQSGLFFISGNRAGGSNFSQVTYNGAAGREKACVDFYGGGAALQYGGIFLKYTSLEDNLFVKVQDNDRNGDFDRIYMYKDTGFPFTEVCGESGLGVTSPFSSGRLIVYLDGGNLKADIDTNFDDIVDQSYTCPNAPAKTGTAIGLGVFGPTRLDNFAAPLSTLTVTKTADTNDGTCDADCSLREAIAASGAGDTIEFASPLFDAPQEIEFNGQLLINKNLTINGPGANLLTLRQTAAGSRVLQIRDVTLANLSGMTFTGGNIGFDNGAGILAGYSTFPAPPGLTLNFSGLNITSNSCGGGGCGLSVSSYNLNLSGSTVSHNSSGYCCGQGGTGGIQFTGANTFNLINSTVSGNRSGNNNSTAAGGIWSNGTLNIINSTITDNEANGGSSGVNVSSGTMTVRNSIIAGNRNNTNMPDVTKTVSSPIVSHGNNIVGNAPAGIGFTNGVNGDRVGSGASPFNPLLASLADNGGSTPTHALLANSPSINNGNNCVTDLSCAANNPPFALTNDQRGLPRDGQVDIGAFEYQPPADSTPPVITPTVSGTLGTNGWYISDVQVLWSVTDAESTVSNQTGCSTETVTSDTAGITFTCAAQSAGGSDSQSVTVKRDATAPTITFTSKTAPNANGWNNSNIAVEWNCSDSVSGAVSSSVTTILSTEGTNQSALGICTDNAGNTAQETQTGIKIDKTAPTITYNSRTPAPNATGWNNTNVQLKWNCSDTLSGVVFGEFNQIVSSQGANQSATGICTDNAGNTASDTKTGIKIDKTPPLTLYLLSETPAPNANGWYNTELTLKWRCTDTLSGVDQTEVSQTISTEGANLTSTGTCADLAGNTDSVTVGSFKIDKTAPLISFNSRTAANANGWNNTNVALAWNCSDTLSGAVNSSVSQTVSTEGANQSARGTCTDLAGNTASDTQSGINIDKTAPTIAFVSRTAANANGWNNSNVSVNWSCADSLSGVANQSVSQPVSSEGANLSSTGQCLDLAGNSASNTQSGIKIDKTNPSISFVNRTAPNAAGWNNTNVTVNWNCSDALSGAASAGVSQVLTIEGANQSAMGTCFDLAGNSASNTQTGIKIDKTAPVINPFANITVSLPENSNTNLMAVNFPLPTAADNLSVPTVSTNPMSGFEFPAGTTVVQITAVDAAGNQSAGSFTVIVQYQFSWFGYSGLFFNEQILNQVTGGSDVPVRFTLSGSKGAPYRQAPTSEPVSCSTFTPTGAETVISRYAPDPFYSPLYDFYQTTWRTQSSWRFTCRRLTLFLNDGTTRSLIFYFK